MSTVLVRMDDLVRAISATYWGKYHESWEALLSLRDCGTCYVSWNLVMWCTSVWEVTF